MIAIDAAANSITLEISDEELARRKSEWTPAAPPASGFERLFSDQILQADEGCDFEFLKGQRGAAVARDYV